MSFNNWFLMKTNKKLVMLTSHLNRNCPFDKEKFKNSPIIIMLMSWMYKLYISINLCSINFDNRTFPPRL